MSGVLRIEHTSSEGTLIDGAGRGDGTGAVLKVNGWRWGRSIGLWYLPMSRDRAPKHDLIEATMAALRAAGYEVEVGIDPTPREGTAIDADFAARATSREQRHLEQEKRHQAAADAARDRADDLSARFAGGQPILRGHYSQAGAERDQRRMHTQMNRAISESAAAVGARENPVTVGNRIHRLRTEVRTYYRRLATVQIS